jgi:hypothetical protein
VKRVQDWPRRLAEEIEQARTQPFDWGRCDCALFAADVVQALTGKDLAAPFRGLYDSRHGAARALLALGYACLEDAATAALGVPRASPALAQRGDVVMVKTAEGPALGICNGSVAACAGPDGLSFVPMPLWLKAWEV